MFSDLTRSAIALALLTLIFGVAYPLLVTGAAQALLHDRAQGSLVQRDGHVVGSSLIGQPFSGDRYVHPRPSAVDWDASASGGSNLGPNSSRLADDIRTRAARIQESEAVPPSRAPIDLLTASGSGLDPHVSVAGARAQARRVAAARGIDVTRVFELIDDHTEHPTLGVLGADRVNVLELNLALDRLDVRD